MAKGRDIKSHILLPMSMGFSEVASMLPSERPPSSHVKAGSLGPNLGPSSNTKKRWGFNHLNLQSFSFFPFKSWLGRAHFLVEGVIHTVLDGDLTECSEWTKVKHVPQNRVVAAFEGTWRGRIRWKRVGTSSYPSSDGRRSTSSSPGQSQTKISTPNISITSFSPASISYSTSRLSTRTANTVDEEEWMTLLDLSTLHVIPKVVRPLERQEPRESRKLWENVTNNLVKKEYSEATKEKIEIEQRQRDEAADRKRKGVQYVFSPFNLFLLNLLLLCRFIPRYFDQNYDNGYAALTAHGLAAVEEELKEDSGYCIEGVDPKTTLAA